MSVILTLRKQRILSITVIIIIILLYTVTLKLTYFETACFTQECNKWVGPFVQNKSSNQEETFQVAYATYVVFRETSLEKVVQLRAYSKVTMVIYTNTRILRAPFACKNKLLFFTEVL